MESKKHIEEEIKYRTELLKLFYFGLITLTGGEIGLLLKMDNLIKLCLFVIGIPFIILFGILIWLQHKRILYLIEQLREE